MLKGDVTGTDDWYGERNEDSTHHSVVTEARPFYDPRHHPAPAALNDSTVDRVHSTSSVPQSYVLRTITLISMQWRRRVLTL